VDLCVFCRCADIKEVKSLATLAAFMELGVV
jgi:hypothetical protein